MEENNKVTELVFEGNRDKILTSSILVAQKFGKNHQHVMRSVRDMLASVQNWTQSENQSLDDMFCLTEYDVSLNNGTDVTRKSPMYVMNKDGFTLLAMGFTGKKALQFKLDYIAAFTAMENMIKEGIENHTVSYHPKVECKMEELCDKLNNVEKTMANFLQSFSSSSKLLQETTPKQPQVSSSDQKNEIKKMVYDYASKSKLNLQQAYRFVYKTLQVQYGVNLWASRQSSGESYLDVAERVGVLDKIEQIIMVLSGDYKDSKNNQIN